MVLALSLACSDGPWKGLPESEIAAWEALRGSTITLEGRVVDAGGEPLSGARVGLRDSSVRTGDDGSFELGGLTRENALVSLSLEGFHDEEAPVHLVRELLELGEEGPCKGIVSVYGIRSFIHYSCAGSDFVFWILSQNRN